jgi:hypothetical protein
MMLLPIPLLWMLPLQRHRLPLAFDALFQVGLLCSSIKYIVDQKPNFFIVFDFALVGPPFCDLDKPFKKELWPTVPYAEISELFLLSS